MPSALSGLGYFRIRVNRYLARFKTVCAMAIRNRKAKDHPARGVRLFRENNARVFYLTDEQEAALMAALPDCLRPVVRFAILPAFGEASCLVSGGRTWTSAAAR